MGLPFYLWVLIILAYLFTGYHVVSKRTVNDFFDLAFNVINIVGWPLLWLAALLKKIVR